MKKTTKRFSLVLLLGLMLLMLLVFTACDNEWDKAIKNTIKELTSDKANYSMLNTCAFRADTEYEYGSKEKVHVDGGKYYIVKSDLNGENETTEPVRNGSYSLVREDYGNDAPYQGMLLGSIKGKFDYFTLEDGKYVLKDDKKDEVGIRIAELTESLDVVKDMYYVIADNRITEFYALFDRSSGEEFSPSPPMKFHLVFEYGNVTI